MADPVAEVYQRVLKPVIRTIAFQFLFYGIYLFLGGTYVSLLLKQWKLEGDKRDKRFKHLFYPISTLVLFILATVGVIISMYDAGNLIQLALNEVMDLNPDAWEERFVHSRTAIGAVYAVANFLGDIILIYRCYHIWCRWQIVVVPTFLANVHLAVAFAGIAEVQIGSKETLSTGVTSPRVTTGHHLLYAFLGFNIFTNLLLTGMIAGRLWWLNRTTKKLLGTTPGLERRYNGIFAMFLESGLHYPVALIVCLAIQVSGSPASMDPILLQIVGIAPMLILVRMTLGISIENTPHEDDSVDTDTDTDTELLPPTASTRTSVHPHPHQPHQQHMTNLPSTLFDPSAAASADYNPKARIVMAWNDSESDRRDTPYNVGPSQD